MALAFMAPGSAYLAGACAGYRSRVAYLHEQLIALNGLKLKFRIVKILVGVSLLRMRVVLTVTEYEMSAAARGVFIVAAKRTPFGTFGGALKDFSATELSAIASRAALAECGAEPEVVDSVIIGNVAQVNSYC